MKIILRIAAQVRLWSILLPLCLAFCLGQSLAPAFAAAPAKPPKMRLALATGGPFKDYQVIFQGMLKGLAERGLIADGDVPLDEDDADLAPLWAWAAKNAGGDRLEFVEDAFYSAGWNTEQRGRNKDRLLERIRKRADIDCILAFGTWAGQDFSSAEFTVPVLVSSVTNAVEAGIISSVEDSGRDNLLAVIEPGRFARQIRVFHDIFAFKRLGIAYEDTPSGRSGISFDEIERETLNLGVELVRCSSMFDIEDASVAARNLRDCHERLAEQGVDAVYIGYNNGMLPEYIPDLLSPLLKIRVPTFTQEGSSAVAYGVLMSVAQSDLVDEGRFSAALLEEILNGKKPRSLSQRFESTLSLAVNLRTAALIGWNIPLEILAAVDEFYK
ncbi:MAG: ABC transporter substrate-binding protein [Deltaproteobacteria bacterium]|jgi:ABC-type uncharacterized transport system substrate-binding protein|nr:ABC transporter substrate-binding protein [Deltaproteobacteria bacterium]